MGPAKQERPPATAGLAREHRETTDKQPPADSYYSDLGIDTLWSGDLLQEEDDLPGEATADTPMTWSDADGQLHYEDDVFRDGRASFERYSLTHTMVRVSIRGPSRTSHAGRLMTASVSGMWVQTKHALPFRAFVRVEMTVMDGYSMTFLGRVVRSTPTGMAVQLTTDDSDWRFRSSFLDLARTPSQRPPTVTVEQISSTDAQRFQQDHEALEALGRQWLEVEADLHNDDAHQVFIKACMEASRLEFAMERYRSLAREHPEGPDPKPYLKQIGTILSFYTLSRNDPTPVRRSRWGMIALIAFIALAGIALLAAPTFNRRLHPRPSGDTTLQADPPPAPAPRAAPPPADAPPPEAAPDPYPEAAPDHAPDPPDDPGPDFYTG